MAILIFMCRQSFLSIDMIRDTDAAGHWRRWTISVEQAADKLAQVSDVYHGSAFAKFSDFCSSCSQLGEAYFTL